MLEHYFMDFLVSIQKTRAKKQGRNMQQETKKKFHQNRPTQLQ